MSLVLQASKLNRALIGSNVYATIPRAPTALPGGAGAAGGNPFVIGQPAGLALRQSGVSANLAGVISTIGKVAIGYTQGGLGGAANALGGILGVGGSKPGSGPTGGAAGTGHTVNTSGTAGGGCITVMGQQVCLGGSAGAGSSFSSGGGTGVVLPTGGSSGAGVTVTPAGTHVVARGYHLNKRGYWTKAGYVAPHSKAVKNRRRNPLNPRALSHALTRMTGFERAASHIEKALGKVARRHIRPARRSSSRAPRTRITARLAPGACGCE